MAVRFGLEGESAFNKKGINDSTKSGPGESCSSRLVPRGQEEQINSG